MSRMRVNAVAFVYDQSPILVRTYTASKDAELKYQYVAHTSLDVIDERGKLLTSQLLLNLLISSPSWV